MVADTHGRDQFVLLPWPDPLEIKVLRYFMRFKPGWWALHVFAIAFTLYLGHIVRFRF
jgi:hypothetical protein